MSLLTSTNCSIYLTLSNLCLYTDYVNLKCIFKCKFASELLTYTNFDQKSSKFNTDKNHKPS